MCGDASSGAPGERPEVLIQESAPRPTARDDPNCRRPSNWWTAANSHDCHQQQRAGPPPIWRMDMRGGPASESWSASSEIWLALGTPMHLLLLSTVISVGKSWASGFVTLFVLQLLWPIGRGSNFWIVSAPAIVVEDSYGGFPLPNGK